LQRYTYDIVIFLFNRKFNEVIIDQHYKKKHNYLNDEIILEILKTSLPNTSFKSSKKVDTYEYFVFDPIYFNAKSYRLIIVIETGFEYVGVVNIFRIKGPKNVISK
jgi:hypothetical protein